MFPKGVEITPKKEAANITFKEKPDIAQQGCNSIYPNDICN
jgi:hypothetical protein